MDWIPAHKASHKETVGLSRSVEHLAEEHFLFWSVPSTATFVEPSVGLRVEADPAVGPEVEASVGTNCRRY